MDVEIIAKGLTKPEALLVEKFEMTKYPENQLWNILNNQSELDSENHKIQSLKFEKDVLGILNELRKS